MHQIRAVVRGGSIARLENILEATGLSSPSEAIAVLISRYGQLLIDTWEIDTTPVPEALRPTPAPQPTAHQTLTIDYSREIQL